MLHLIRLLIIFAFLPLQPATAQSNLREGDIVFQDSKSAQCEAIRAATGSAWTHCGILFLSQDKWMVLEAVQPVSVTSLELWRLRNRESFAVKRLKGSDTLLTTAVMQKMGDVGGSFMGKRYDIYFNWSDTEIYCSELVWKIYHAAGIDLCALKPLRSYNLQAPIVKTVMKQRYGKNIPLNEKMVAPGDLFNSPLLVNVPIQ